VNILFRCDGSVKLGMGHVVRCLALADHLSDNHNCTIQFAMRQFDLGIIKIKESYPVMESNENYFHYEEWLTDCVEKSDAHVLIMDMRDGLTRVELNSIKKETGIKVVTIDDPEDKRLEADLAFYPPVPQLTKLAWDGFKGVLYVGWEYVILRKEFSFQYDKINSLVPTILVAMGGTDEKNMTEFIIQSLNSVNNNFEAKIIVGSGYPYLKQLKKKLKDVNFKFELFHNPKNIAGVMSQADCAIISFGQTAYELAALRVPSLYLCLTEDHLSSSQLFVNHGVGVSLGLFAQKSDSELIEELEIHLNEKQASNDSSNHSKLLNISDLAKMSSLIIEGVTNV
jgi:UDP-2,4-diacetamido-2,4,6-trideoxy-beta-L-altropyranose hydrolase